MYVPANDCVPARCAAGPDLLGGSEEGLLAAFEDAVRRLAVPVVAAYAAGGEWTERIRAALAALLDVVDAEPALARLVFIESLAAPTPVLERRAEVIATLATAIDEGRAGVEHPELLSPLTAQCVVGSTVGVIYAHLVSQEWQGAPPIPAALNELMAVIVLPYRGRSSCARELSRAGGAAGARASVSTDTGGRTA
jgi:AcrR family transcriptional regulator